MWKAIITETAFLAATATFEVTFDVYNNGGNTLEAKGLTVKGSTQDEINQRIRERLELMKAAKNELNNIEIGTEITI